LIGPKQQQQPNDISDISFVSDASLPASSDLTAAGSAPRTDEMYGAACRRSSPTTKTAPEILHHQAGPAWISGLNSWFLTPRKPTIAAPTHTEAGEGRWRWSRTVAQDWNTRPRETRGSWSLVGCGGLACKRWSHSDGKCCYSEACIHTNVRVMDVTADAGRDTSKSPHRVWLGRSQRLRIRLPLCVAAAGGSAGRAACMLRSHALINWQRHQPIVQKYLVQHGT